MPPPAMRTVMILPSFPARSWHERWNGATAVTDTLGFPGCAGGASRKMAALASGRSGCLGLEMAEHDVARLVVHFGLEGELVLQRERAGRGRPCRHFIDQPLYIGIFRVDLLAEYERRQPGPAPERHVHDGVGIADHIAAPGEMIVENAVVAMRFELVAVVRVFQVFRRVVLEMHRLSRIRAEAGGDEHQP